MCDPFGLDCALQPIVGNSLLAADAIIGFAVMAVIAVSLEFLFATTRKSSGKSGQDTWLLSWATGFVVAIIFGWIPVWVPFLIVFVIAWILMDPMGSGKRANG